MRDVQGRRGPGLHNAAMAVFIWHGGPLQDSRQGPQVLLPIDRPFQGRNHSAPTPPRPTGYDFAWLFWIALSTATTGIPRVRSMLPALTCCCGRGGRASRAEGRERQHASRTVLMIVAAVVVVATCTAAAPVLSSSERDHGRACRCRRTEAGQSERRPAPRGLWRCGGGCVRVLLCRAGPGGRPQHGQGPGLAHHDFQPAQPPPTTGRKKQARQGKCSNQQ